jgi:hypothetical protein
MRIFTAIIFTLLSVFAYATEPLRIPVDGTPLKSAIINEEAPAEIDLLIVYTSEAKTWASTRGGIDTLIARGMRLTNQAHANSQTGVTFKLVKAHQTDYVENGSSLIDLRRLTFGYDVAFDGAGGNYLAYERKLRDSLGADLIVFVPARGTSAGLAWQLSTEQGRPVYGTSVVMVHYIDKSSFPHEIGHNMGAHHHYAQTSSPGPGLYSYSSGYNWRGSDGKDYVSVMSYTSGYPDGFRGARIELFSNPDVLHLSAPIGHPDLANNAKTIRRTKHTVAAYRARPVTYIVTLTIKQMSYNAFDFKVNAEGAELVGLEWGKDTIETSTTVFPPLRLLYLDTETDYYVRGWAMKDSVTYFSEWYKIRTGARPLSSTPPAITPQIIIYPNPTDGVIWISYAGRFNFTIDRVDGVRIHKSRTHQDITAFPLQRGLYVVRVSTLNPEKLTKTETVIRL